MAEGNDVKFELVNPYNDHGLVGKATQVRDNKGQFVWIGGGAHEASDPVAVSSGCLGTDGKLHIVETPNGNGISFTSMATEIVTRVLGDKSKTHFSLPGNTFANIVTTFSAIGRSVTGDTASAAISLKDMKLGGYAVTDVKTPLDNICSEPGLRYIRTQGKERTGADHH